MRHKCDQQKDEPNEPKNVQIGQKIAATLGFITSKKLKTPFSSLSEKPSCVSYYTEVSSYPTPLILSE